MSFDDDVLARFRREMLGSMVAHMTNAELAEWIAPFQAVTGDGGDEPPPVWFVKRRNEARVELLRVLSARARKKRK